MWFKFVGKKLPIFYCLTIQCSIPLIEVLLQAIGSGIPEIPYFSHSPPVGWGGEGGRRHPRHLFIFLIVYFLLSARWIILRLLLFARGAMSPTWAFCALQNAHATLLKSSCNVNLVISLFNGLCGVYTPRLP